MKSDMYYRHSGRIALMSPIKPLATCLPWVLVLAAVYAVAIRYNPFIYFSFVATVVFGALVGAITNMSAQAARSRSHVFNGLLGVLFGCVAVWAQWLVWLKLSAGISWSGLLEIGFSSPFTWIAYLGEFSSHWHVQISRLGRHGAEMSPSSLCWLWSAEAAAIVGLSGFAAYAPGKSEAFNERTGRWAKKVQEVEFLADDTSAAGWRERIENDVVGSLSQLYCVDEGSEVREQRHSLKVTFLEDKEDADFRLISVDRAVSTPGDAGKKPRVRTETVCALRFLHSDEYAALRAHVDVDAKAKAAQKQQLSEADDPPELLGAIAALKAGRHDEVITLARPYLDAADVALRGDALRLCALADSRLGRWADANLRFRALFDLEPTTHNALQVATTHVMCGALVEGDTWFAKANEINANTNELPAGRVRTAYMSALELRREWHALLPHLDWLAAAYCALGITDSHFVWTRGLPFFSEFLEKSLPILRQCMPLTDVRAWYAALREAVDDDGKKALDAHVAAMS